MDLKKRIVVTVALVLFIFQSSLVFGVPTDQSLEYSSIFLCTDKDDNSGFGGNGFKWILKGELLTESDCSPDEGDNLNCEIKLNPNPSDQGCWIAAGDTGNTHECISVKAREEITIKTSDYFSFKNKYNIGFGGFASRSSPPLGGGFAGEGAIPPTSISERDPYEIAGNAIKFGLEGEFQNDATAKLCSDDHYWHGCSLGTGTDDPDTPQNEDTTSTIGTFTWANDNLYECIKNDYDTAEWKLLGVDKDHDGYVTEGENYIDYITEPDCYDDPSSDAEICSEIEDAAVDCEDLDYSSCAVCINPGAAEICGEKEWCWVKN